MKVIAFVGMPGAGKTEASNVARELDIPVIVMGDVLREEVKKRGLPPTDENIGGVANQLRKEEGMDAIAKRCIPKIEALKGQSDVVVVDGIRGIAEVEAFKKAFDDNFTLVKIDATVRAQAGPAGQAGTLRRHEQRRMAAPAGRERAVLGHGRKPSMSRPCRHQPGPHRSSGTRYALSW